MRKMWIALGVVVALLGAFVPASAQNTTGLVVQTCGTVVNAFIPNNPGPFTVDVNGNLCTSGGGGGGGGLSVQDGATFTAGTSNFTPTGGEYNSSPTSLTSGKQGTLALNQFRAAFVDVMTTNSNLYTVLNNTLSALNTAPITQSHTCSTAGYGIGSCLGQLDDDVKAPIAAGSAIIGKVGIDQTTPGTTNLVQTPTTTNGGAATVKGGVASVNGGSIWNTVAASQTAQVLSSTQAGGTGAVGDYLSHCVVYPTSTSPGVVTVFDGTNTATNDAIAFPGGASSISNLVPFAIPVGSVSVNSGGWKVTTGANVSVTCYGKFT